MATRATEDSLSGDASSGRKSTTGELIPANLYRACTITIRRLDSTDLNRLTGLCLGRIVLRGLSLALRRQREVGEVELAALRVRADQIRFLGVEEREGLAAGPVRVDAHPG